MKIRILIRTREIKVLLAKKNKDYEWLAGQLSTTANYINHLLNGRKNPGDKLRERIIIVFRGHPWDRLFEVKECGDQ